MLQEKGSSVCGLHPCPCVRGCKGPSFTQGPKGWWGSSGSQGSKTSERGRNTETEEEKQRWAEMGRIGRNADGRRIFFFKKKREESTRFSGGCDTQVPESKQQMMKQREVEQMKG